MVVSVVQVIVVVDEELVVQEELEELGGFFDQDNEEEEEVVQEELEVLGGGLYQDDEEELVLHDELELVLLQVVWFPRGYKAFSAASVSGATSSNKNERIVCPCDSNDCGFLSTTKR
ncbi:uncharacterized protein PV09_05569 [Verruconis gallopava]|uniref:Uncharacterized protein n=1 Tax=Verruconis gallopava TaxID=253628 RepID=A0A0D1XLR5_9PEZI|nr:uncharacterized protein PV09_05569 [Verruconis gallopava]KIW03361.1 hypothetical protein PV09_05569 [Verruconis gallopava]